jgi:hypothetical protein
VEVLKWLTPKERRERAVMLATEEWDTARNQGFEVSISLKRPLGMKINPDCTVLIKDGGGGGEGVEYEAN